MVGESLVILAQIRLQLCRLVVHCIQLLYQPHSLFVELGSFEIVKSSVAICEVDAFQGVVLFWQLAYGKSFGCKFVDHFKTSGFTASLYLMDSLSLCLHL